SRLKTLRTEGAFVSAGGESERPADRPGVTELPGIIGEIFFRDDVLADVPAAIVAAQDQLELHFPFFIETRDRITVEEIGHAVVANHFAQRFVGTGVFEFGIDYGVDPMLSHHGTNAVLPAEAGKNRAVVLSALTVEVELGGPPGLHAVFEFNIGAEEQIRSWRMPGDIEHFDFQISRLLHFVAVGDKVRAFLRSQEWRERKNKKKDSRFHFGATTVATQLHLLGHSPC